MNRPSNLIALFFFPIILLITVWILKDALGFYYLWRFDQSYAYLINSLNVSQFHGPGGVAHPGTPLQILGALVFKIIYNLSDHNTDFVNHVLLNSEYYLLIFQRFLLILNVIALIFLGFFTFKVTKNLITSIFLQMSVFVSSSIYYSLYIIIAEQLLIFCDICLMAAIIYYLFKPIEKVMNIKYIFLLSMICGIGLTSKLNFFPVLIIPFIILKGVKNRLLFLSMTFIIVLVLLIPVLSQFNDLLIWIKSLVIHDGLYGQGNSDIINLKTFFENLGSIISTDLYFTLSFLSLCVTLIIVLIKKSDMEGEFIQKSKK